MAQISKAEDMLRKVYGHHSFRPGQKELAEGLLAGRDVLGIMPTGAGKSLCYQIPALLLSGTTIVISPLISLMKDQVTALKLRGIAAACLNSAMDEADYQQTVHQVADGTLKILYVAPERLQTPGFLSLCRQISIPLVAVDEAHCISQWGQDFRPNYLKIPDFIASLPRRPAVGAFTATATPDVRKDILTNLKLEDPVSLTTGFDRPNLSFSVYFPKDRDQALSDLLRDRFRQSGIIYCSTRKNVESVCSRLNQEGFSATRYHAGLDPEERRQNQEDFLFDRRRVMVATNAFGMGIDKSNVSYVIHYNMPKSLEAYYQEAGRAGRDGCDADCILLYAPQDVDMAHWLIDHSDPNPDLTPEQQSIVRERDRERVRWMAYYANSRRCLRRDLLHYFGEFAPEHCGNCSNCVPDCEHTDITTEAQMILSCVTRIGQRHTQETVLELMRGVVPSPLPEGLRPEELSTFGLMKDASESTITEILQALLDQGYLERDGNELLRLTGQSREVLFNHRRVVMRRRLKARGSIVGENMFQALQKLRFTISSREYIAASVLFSDGTLREICRVLPKNKKELAAVDGMGVYKASQYGDDILSILRFYGTDTGRKKAGSGRKAANGRDAKPRNSAKGTAFSSYREGIIEKGNVEAYQPWSEEEDRRLAEEYRSGISVEELAGLHKRTRGAILSRLKKLNLL